MKVIAQKKSKFDTDIVIKKFNTLNTLNFAFFSFTSLFNLFRSRLFQIFFKKKTIFF